MTFKKYNHTNNAFCELLTDLQSSDATMMLTGNFNRLPTSNFIVKISKYQGTKCVARENVYVANRNNNICTGLIRAYEKVPMDDDATEWIQQALNFSVGDMVECVVSSEVIRDLQNGIIEDKFSTYKQQLFFGCDRPVWQKIGNFSGWVSSRLNLRFMGGHWFWANDPNCSDIIECVLTIGNEQHTRNINWFWLSIFKTNPLIRELRVIRINNLSWDIYVSYNAYSSNTMIEINCSGTFTKSFLALNPPEISGDTVYNISEKTQSLNLWLLQEDANYSSIYDTIPFVKNWENKKVTIENLGKWLWNSYATKNFTKWISTRYWTEESQSIAVPKWAIVSLSSGSYNGSSRSASISISHSTDNSQFQTIFTVEYWQDCSIFVPSWFIKISSYSTDYAFRAYVVQAF